MNAPKYSGLSLVAMVWACGGRMEDEVATDLRDPTNGSGSHVGGSHAGGSNAVSSNPSTYATLVPPSSAVGGAYTTAFGSGGAGATGYLGGGGAIATTYVAGGFGATSSSTTPFACDNSTNFVAVAALGENGNWIDNVCGVSGAFYAFSDQGLDGIDGTADDTVQSPAVDPSNGQRKSPCNGGKCCIAGRTSPWPQLSAGSGYDYNANVWGGGIGLTLNASRDGSSALYSGPAQGFAVTLSGTLNGHALRIAYTQSPYDEAAPFSLAWLGVNTILFTDASCPTWTTDCERAGNNPFDLQIQVVGGDTTGPFELCVTSITPLILFML